MELLRTVSGSIVFDKFRFVISQTVTGTKSLSPAPRMRQPLRVKQRIGPPRRSVSGPPGPGSLHLGWFSRQGGTVGADIAASTWPALQVGAAREGSLAPPPAISPARAGVWVAMPPGGHSVVTGLPPPPAITVVVRGPHWQAPPLVATGMLV